jgi:hypothetical protein
VPSTVDPRITRAIGELVIASCAPARSRGWAGVPRDRYFTYCHGMTLKKFGAMIKWAGAEAWRMS